MNSQETVTPGMGTAPAAGPTIIVKPAKKNSLGTAGLVFSIIALLGSWIPVVGTILWVIGAILSFIGVFKAPRGRAIAGLVISFIAVIIIGFILGMLGVAAAVAS